MAHISIPHPALPNLRALTSRAGLSGIASSALYVVIGAAALALGVPAAIATAQAVPMFEECYEPHCAAP
jgi:hypothetical protein